MSSTRRRLFIGAYLLLIGYILLAWSQTNLALFGENLASSLIALSRLSALLGTFSILLQFILISRAPWLEPAFGFDKLTRIHHYNGLAAFTLITAHIILIIAGNAMLAGIPLPAQLLVFVRHFSYVWLALIAYLVLLVTIPTSIVIAKRRLKYELWYLIHIFNYAVIFLALWHQVVNGLTLIGNDWLRYGWYGLHVLVLTNLVVYRFLLPVRLQIKHRFRVEKVTGDTNGVRSIYVKGKRMDEFVFEAGQFNKWRFLQKGFWKEEHPFTISIEPNGEYLRLTPKSLGDYTSRLDDIKPGTPVVISGPLGTFTLQRTHNRKLLFIAGGIGITPLRAMMGAADKTYDITLLYAAKNRSELALKDELELLAAEKGFKVNYVLSAEKVKGYLHGYVNKKLLQKAVIDLSDRDVFLCGPPPMMGAVGEALKELGVDKSAIHTEKFSL